MFAPRSRIKGRSDLFRLEGGDSEDTCVVWWFCVLGHVYFIEDEPGAVLSCHLAVVQAGLVFPISG